MPVIGRIDVHAIGADMHVLTAALVFHMDAAPSHVGLFSFFGVDNVDALFKGDVYALTAFARMEARPIVARSLRLVGLSAHLSVVCVLGVVHRRLPFRICCVCLCG